jgi:Phage tail tube protein
MAGPYNFNSQWKQARNLVLSPNSQLAWNTALATEYLTQTQRFDGSAILELVSSRRSDIEYSGKQTAFATNGQPTMYDTKFSGFKAECTPWLAGYLFAFLMGKDTVTGAGPYTHSFTFDETTRTAVPTTIYVEDTEAIKYTCPDMCVSDLTVSISEIGAIMLEATMMGTGRQVIGAMESLPALPSDSYILGSDAAATFGPVGDTASFIGRVMSATFKFDNQLTVHKAPGGGLYGIFVRKGNPKFSFTATIAAKDTDDVYTLFENDTASALSIAANSGASAQLTIALPQVHLKSTKLGFDGEMIVWQVEGDETSCYDLATVPPISATVINALATYLVGH